jgi:multiple sugar transport system substrate-binding protein
MLRSSDGLANKNTQNNPDAGKKVLEYIGGAPAEVSYLKFDEWDVGLAQGLPVPSYNSIQTKSVQAISACKSVSQFMDRDTDPAMANAMITLIQKFIDSPSTSTIASIQKTADAQAKTIFTA